MTDFTAYDFIAKWKTVALTERSAAQQHFLDLCRLFGHPTPVESDKTGQSFTFEKGVTKTGGGGGFADVWKKGFFAWEYKKKKNDLKQAIQQLSQYAAALENPPLHVACDTHIFRIETRFNNEAPAVYQFDLEQLTDPDKFEILRRVFFEPEKLRSGKDRKVLTKIAADNFQRISDGLQKRNPDREAVAHFVNQLVFCFFANSVGLLPEGMWRKVIVACDSAPHLSQGFFQQLFDSMAEGGFIAFDEVRAFNGGLFDKRPALALEFGEIQLLFSALNLDWSLIDPTIFGTLFERFLDPDKRAQIGAHYTDPDKIMLIVEPVIARPLLREWEAAKAEIVALLLKKNGAALAAVRRDAFIERLCALRILDPACGSGNFLYLALQTVKDIENRAIQDCAQLGLPYVAPRVGPEILHGIEINPLAAELARTTIWIGDIQWRVKNAVLHHPKPILRKLDTIECRDALLKILGGEAEWPEADFLIGNPPFLGGKLMRRGLGDEYVEDLFYVFANKVPAEADLVCYWFFKAWEAIQVGRATRCGFVATNSVRGGANRRVLQPIAEKGAIFEAWSDEPWTVEGAAVRVSLVMFAKDGDGNQRLNGVPTASISADLTSAEATLIDAKSLAQNSNLMFQGVKFGGPFELDEDPARQMLRAPLNPNGRPNSDVISPWINGNDIVRRPPRKWCVDFGWKGTESDASLFQEPFEAVRDAFESENQQRLERGEKPLRAGEEKKSAAWWLHQRPRAQLRTKLKNLSRWIAVAEVARHRIVALVDARFLPSGSVYVVARDDDTTFGVLHSRFHEAWSLRLGTWLGVGNDPRYTPTTTFETFPFPAGLTPNIPAQDYADDPRAQKIAAAAKKLDELRRNWLNPPDLVDIVPEVTPTAAPGEAPRRYPDRILPKNPEAAKILKTRTLTNLYNERPSWLQKAHEALDRAVAAAYGWPQDISTDDALARLLALNAERAAKP